MCSMKHDAIVDSGIPIHERVPIPDEMIPADSRVEIDAKIQAGYFTTGNVMSMEELANVKGRGWEDVDVRIPANILERMTKLTATVALSRPCGRMQGRGAASSDCSASRSSPTTYLEAYSGRVRSAHIKRRSRANPQAARSVTHPRINHKPINVYTFSTCSSSMPSSRPQSSPQDSHKPLTTSKAASP